MIAITNISIITIFTVVTMTPRSLFLHFSRALLLFIARYYYCHPVPIIAQACGLESKFRVSPLVTPIILPHLIPYKPHFKEFRP